VEAAERARERLHTLTCYHPSRQDGWRDTDWFKTHVPDQTPSRATTLPARMGGATQIGSKRTFQIKLIDGLTSSRVQTTFAVHAWLIVHAPTRP